MSFFHPTAAARAGAQRRVKKAVTVRMVTAVACIASAGILSPGISSASTPSSSYPYTKIPSPVQDSTTRWGERLASAALPGPLGGAPAVAGDLDGDGVNDVFAGQPDQNRVYALSGKTRQVIYSFTRPEASSFFGFVISVLGDVNGDGKPDLAAGTDGASGGKAWIFSGANGSTLRPLTDPAPQLGSNPDRFNPGRFGSRLGRAGDVNNDRVPDVIVGAPGNDVCVSQSCRNAVASAGVQACGDLASVPSGCRMDQGQAFVFSGVDGALIRTLNMPDPDQPLNDCTANCGTFGLAVQGLGDVNGDSIVDHLVGAPSYNYDTATGGGPGVPGGSCQGAFTSACNTAQGRMYLFSGANGALLARIDDPVPQALAKFGFQDAAPLSPGDVNGDRVAEIYGNGFEQNGPNGLASAGRAWVFDGKETVRTGKGAVLYEVVSPQPKRGGQFGWSLAPTDYDGDSRPDLYIGSAPHHVTSTLAEPVDESGGTYVFKGADGSALKTLVLTGSDAQAGTPQNTTLGTMGEKGSQLGWAVAAPGDVNLDGEPDYWAGAPYQNVGDFQDQGLVAVFLSQGARLKVPADFDGNTITDVSVFRPSNGTWYIRGANPDAQQYGASGDIPVPADYDGDGDVDIAVFRPSNGTWYFRGANPDAVAYGTNGDIPVPADYTGDGKADLALFRPSNGTWYIKGLDPDSVAYGTKGDIPIPADYYGDGKADIALFRPSNNTWYIKGRVPDSSAYGTNGDIPVPADYSGDGKADLAVFRPSNGTWYYMRGSTPESVAYGTSGDMPMPGNYSGDGKADITLYRPSSGTWYLLGASPDAIQYGTTGDIPLSLPAAIRMAYFG